MKTYHDQQTVQCPACLRNTICRTVSTITEGTKELNDLFIGTLNKTKCNACSAEFLIDVPLVYRDDKKRVLVYYAPSVKSDHVKEVINELKKLYRHAFAELPDTDKPRCRLTISRRDFIEKIAIYQHEYDDRLIEYIKYQLFQHSTKGLNPHRMDLLFDFSTTTNERLNFLAFDRKTGKAVYALEFLHDDYNQLKQYFFKSSEMENRLDQLYQNHYVHVSNIL